MAVGLQESRPGGNAPLPFMGRTTDKGRFRFFRFRFRFSPNFCPSGDDLDWWCTQCNEIGGKGNLLLPKEKKSLVPQLLFFSPKSSV